MEHPAGTVRIGIDLGGSKIEALAIDAEGRELARQRIAAPGGDYALTVKANQKELVQTLETLLTPGRFSPCAHAADPRPDPRSQSQPA